MYEARLLPRRRTAFTLIELLVVMALILVIFGLGIGYVVFGQDNQHTVVAAQAVTGATLNAKQRARRDGLPTGIRILFAPATDVKGNPAIWASQIQFIQQPEDYNAGWCQSDPTVGPAFDPNKVCFVGADFLGGASFLGELDEATVQAGDYFTVAGTGVVHQIAKVNYPPYPLNPSNPFSGSVELASPLGAVIAPGTAYTIIRGPRKLPSEDVISLPPTMVVDFGACNTLPLRTLIDFPPAPLPPDPTPYNGITPRKQQVAEILFAPSGGVVGQGTASNKILLWLRDPAQPTPYGGAPLIVSIQVRTGSIEAFPVAPFPTPYRFANDPRYSGS
jgi:prepilin-type N-terminal cleavage/methylation domain-containing protein